MKKYKPVFSNKYNTRTPSPSPLHEIKEMQETSWIENVSFQDFCCDIQRLIQSYESSESELNSAKQRLEELEQWHSKDWEMLKSSA